MEELHNHTQNAEKFKGVLDEDASIYQKREVKSGREQMAELHGKDKWIFFRDYYSKKLLVIVLVIVVVIQFIYNYVTTADYALNILAINATGEGNEEFETSYFTEFLEKNEIDTSKYEASVNRSITVDANSSDSFSAYSVEAIVTLFAAQEVDLFLADADYYQSLASSGYSKDLRDYLTEEELAALDEDVLIYATIEEDEDEYDEGYEEETETGAEAELSGEAIAGEETAVDEEEDSAAGETILAGIRLSQDEGWLGEMNWYEDGFDVVIGLSASCKHEELAVALLKEILFYE